MRLKKLNENAALDYWKVNKIQLLNDIFKNFKLKFAVNEQRIPKKSTTTTDNTNCLL